MASDYAPSHGSVCFADTGLVLTDVYALLAQWAGLPLMVDAILILRKPNGCCEHTLHRYSEVADERSLTAASGLKERIVAEKIEDPIFYAVVIWVVLGVHWELDSDAVGLPRGGLGEPFRRLAVLEMWRCFEVRMICADSSTVCVPKGCFLGFPTAVSWVNAAVYRADLFWLVVGAGAVHVGGYV
ncbi:hypothetical protein Nepgr_023020 [Nepenthes gracilis]|uniref:Uncharacterized protein n=1 Tax=Nepenthes gracilis TaxID=150966 RepID=A0AAD3XXI7_NEPGR|nr:hypothetical protein Nepgr_023020 [Nepenthes gracilis]